jgi:PKD repeat protein
MLTSIFAAMAPMGCAIWGDVTFDVPSTVSIGDTFTLAGTANRGECVDIAVDDYVYSLLNDLVIDEHGQFSRNINTATAGIAGFQIPGWARLKGYIDRAAGAGAVGLEETDNGSTVILMVRGDLVVWLSSDTIALDDDFTIKGNATPNSSLNLLIISPKGSGGTLIDGSGKGIYNTTVTAASNGTFSKRINVGFNVDVGSYAIVVLSPGADGVYNGLPPGTSVDNFMEELEKKYNLFYKTQEQLIAIISDATIAAAGSDDLLYVVYVKVEAAYVKLEPIMAVGVGEPLVVTGTTNREEGFAIVVTAKGPTELIPQVVLVENGTFTAIFDTSAAKEGTYTVKADDGDGHTDTTLVEIFAPMNYPPTAIIDSITPDPAKQGTDAVSFIGHGNDSDGSLVAYNWSSSTDGLLNTSSSFTKPASELSVGTHTIYFTVQDDDGAWSSAATGILMITPPNQPPVASFIYSPVNPWINEAITFNASFSLDQDGNIVSYNWSFGDGNISNTSEVVITHSYSSVGNYTVNLTVTDDEGATNTTSQELQVCLKPPIATFTCSPPNPVVNETVTFNASESYDPNGVVTTYQFEFGDGTKGTGEVVTHAYSSVGTYTVNLSLTDNEGATNRTSKTIKVFANISYFDTEPGAYPSISGTHNGTITMTHTVNVSKVYIYPCTGTGGHVEYAKIWNSSWDGAEAHWNGYVGDWYNCSFDKNFALVAGETYNYTIVTESYPQIHHTAELLTAKGWITCEDFVEINGKRHEGWIPAITLWSD